MTAAGALLIAAAVFAGAFVQSVAGFGLALIAMPLVSLVLPLTVAVPAQGVFGATVALSVLARHWREMRWRDAAVLILGSALGLPIGIWLLHIGAPGIVKTALGVILIAYGLFELFLRARLSADAEAAAQNRPSGFGAAIAGFAAGVMGGAYATNGPPAVVYGTLRRWPAPRFKSTMQAFFLVNNVMIVLGHAARGLFTESAATLLAVGLPALAAGLWLGTRLESRVSGPAFRKLVLVLIVILGVSLVVR